MLRRILTLALVVAGLAAVPLAQASPAGAAPTVPSGYRMVQYDAGMFEYDLTNFTTIPGTNTMLATGKSGRLTRVDIAGDGLSPSDANVSILGNMPTYYQGDRGMLGISLAQDYAATRHVFILWDYCQSSTGVAADDQACIAKGGLPTGRLSRMTLNGTAAAPTSIDFTSEVVVMDNLPSWSPTPGATCTDSHTIGTVISDGSGGLFLGNGDSSSYCGTMDPSSLSAQDIFSPRGKIFHIKEDGSPIATNPFINAKIDGGNNYPVRDEYWAQRVFAYGLRNPFRFTLNGPSLLTGDVGWNSMEEIDSIGAGQNMGWPCLEGTLTTSLSSDPKCPTSGFTAPVITWNHVETDRPAQSAAVGGVLAPASWPGIGGTAIYGDYARGDLFTAPRVPFGALGSWGSVTSIQNGPFGDVYVSDIGKVGTGPGHITRVHFESSTNAIPTVTIAGGPLVGGAPLNVAWTATAADADGTITAWQWNYGDGSPVVVGAGAPPGGAHTYTVAGTYKAVLTVTDNSGSSASATQTVSVGNNPPILTVVQPIGLSHIGDHLHVIASAADPDGDAVSIAYQQVIHHCPSPGDCHAHPGAFQDSPDFIFPDHGSNSPDYYLEIVVKATDARGATSTQSVNYLLNANVGPTPTPPGPTPPAGSGLRYNPMPPTRLFDTRQSGRLVAQTPLSFSLAGHKAAVLNVTVDNPHGTGYLRVYPCSQPPGLQTSTVNFNAGQTVANVAFVSIPDDGMVCAWSQFDTDLIIDLSGFFDDAGLAYTPVDPQRLMDTRGTGQTFGAGGQVLYTLSGAPVDAQGVLVNLTVDGPQGPGYLRAYPCTAESDVSNVNYVAGQTTSNFAAIQITGDATNKTWCYRSYAQTDAIADLAGFFTQDGLTYTAVDPTRLFDTRQTDGFARLQPMQEMSVNLGLPGNVGAAVLNITAANPGINGYVQVYPCGTSPSTSSVNYAAHQTAAANMTVVRVPANGMVCFRSLAATDLVVDLSGWFS